MHALSSPTPSAKEEARSCYKGLSPQWVSRRSDKRTEGTSPPPPPIVQTRYLCRSGSLDKLLHSRQRPHWLSLAQKLQQRKPGRLVPDIAKQTLHLCKLNPRWFLCPKESGERLTAAKGMPLERGGGGAQKPPLSRRRDSGTKYARGTLCKREAQA